MATAQEDAIGLTRRALVLRAKYRVRTEKRQILVSILGAHPLNRSGVFPTEETVMNLGMAILEIGFSVDEANHEGVCVQEVPADEAKNVKLGAEGPYETYLAYNKRKTASVKALSTTFSQAHSIVYGTLSRNRLFLILRATSSGAKWPINADSKHAGLNKLHDPEGRWSLSAAATQDLNFNVWVHTGLRTEVLPGQY